MTPRDRLCSMTLPRALRTLAGLALALAMGGCVLDWDHPSGSSTGGVAVTECEDTCSCAAGETCLFSCAVGSCNIVCEPGSTCTVDGGSGSVSMSCAAGATCIQSCGSGDCNLTCTSSAVCSQDCGSGDCGLSCTTTGSCTQDCGTGGCTCTGC